MFGDKRTAAAPVEGTTTAGTVSTLVYARAAPAPVQGKDKTGASFVVSDAPVVAALTIEGDTVVVVSNFGDALTGFAQVSAQVPSMSTCSTCSRTRVQPTLAGSISHPHISVVSC